MTNVAILTEAGGTVGFGHLMRCKAIADCIDADIYVHADGKYPNNNFIDYEWRNDTSRFIKLLSNDSSILIDSYLAESSIYSILSSHFHHVSVIDDYNRIAYPVNLVINPGIQLPDYTNQTAKVIGGCEYIILRKEIINHVRKSQYDEYKNLLITFGGCDAGEIFDWLIPLIRTHQNLTATIITGDNQNCKVFSNKFNGASIRWLGQVDAKTMADLMCQSDICISAGGQTLHELAYIGVPTIAIETGADQLNNVKGYLENGFLLEKLSLQTPQLSSIIDSLLITFSDTVLRQKVVDCGRLAVDGKGAERISSILTAALSFDV